MLIGTPCSRANRSDCSQAPGIIQTTRFAAKPQTIKTSRNKADEYRILEKIGAAASECLVEPRELSGIPPKEQERFLLIS
ncbi:MAG TPA: hypothetical protein VG099_11285 [Gemmataceae bacterium]|jgi:hypothetical protein|nr:hypothetical protein [Gemmataceae bacterium]